MISPLRMPCGFFRLVDDVNGLAVSSAALGYQMTDLCCVGYRSHAETASGRFQPTAYVLRARLPECRVVLSW